MTATLTLAAQDKAAELLAKEGRDDLALRLAVQPGGCSGLRYQMFFDDRQIPGDQVSQFPHGLRLVIDQASVPYLDSVTIDYHDSIERQGFTIDNPHAASTCACGDSFS